ncbi:dienelactone hydrolase family protein [Motilimonas sp. KMU-193]|uniref:alpha/beta hydrolase n=1 Tax=Motilimonas sp. KMU-193 TaxID=3388668 RepID=UPI00396B46A3
MKLKMALALLTTFVAVVIFFIPGVSMPKPDGKYQAGVTQFELGEGENWIQVMAWYPGEATADAKFFPYMPQWLGQAIAKQQGLPEVLFTDDGISSSYLDIPVAAGQHPILIYNHGYGSTPMQSMTQFEQLASHGYIVLSLGHPGDSLVLKRLQGELIHQTAQASIELDETTSNTVMEMGPYWQQLARSENRQQWQQRLAEIEQLPLFERSNARFDYWVANNELLLDSLIDLQSGAVNSLLQSHLNLAKIGAYGHSFGGAVSVAVALKRPEVLAVLNMDGPQFRFEQDQVIDKPICFVYGDESEGLFASYQGINDTLLKDVQAEHCSVTFKGANHNNFTDVNYITPMKYFGLIGEVDNQQMGKALNNLLLGYFDWQLNGADPWQSQHDMVKTNKLALTQPQSD